MSDRYTSTKNKVEKEDHPHKLCKASLKKFVKCIYAHYINTFVTSVCIRHGVFEWLILATTSILKLWEWRLQSVCITFYRPLGELTGAVIRFESRWIIKMSQHRTIPYDVLDSKPSKGIPLHTDTDVKCWLLVQDWEKE